jgi:hypothetical protein
MIYVKIHNGENGNIIAMCDSSLIDKIISDGELEINIRDYSDFYKGSLVDGKKALSMINPATMSSANIIGKESVKIAIEGSIILEESVKLAGKIPYAYAFKIKY